MNDLHGVPKYMYKKGVNDAIVRVLEIIDRDISKTSNEQESTKSARMSELRFLREKIEALRGGDG